MNHIPRISILALAALTAAIVITACESNPTAEPTQPNTPQPVATFQTIQVTVPPDETPTPEPTPAGTPTTRGVERSFPELLKTSETITVGPLMTTWQSYLDNSVVTFENSILDLCGRGNGVAAGDIMTGGIVWTLGLPREGMLGNEVFLLLWNPETDIGRSYVLGYVDDTPVFKAINNYDNYDTVTPFTYEGDPIPFESYELTTCLNL